MIVIYAGISFLFYKIFPALAGHPDNTVLGAFLMGACTAIILQCFEILTIRLFLRWQVKTLASNQPAEFPNGAAFVMIIGATVATASCFLIATGFAERLARWGARHEVEFTVMAAIPPTAYLLVKLVELWRGWTTTETQRKAIGDDRNE